MRLPSFTSNNKRCEVPSQQHLRYIQNVSCVLKFKFNLTAYVTQQSYPKNTRTELEWKRNCRNEALEGKRVGRLLFTYTSEGGPELTSRCCCGVFLSSQSSCLLWTVTANALDHKVTIAAWPSVMKQVCAAVPLTQGSAVGIANAVVSFLFFWCYSWLKFLKTQHGF